jgi:hypothetical protein
MGTNYYWSNPAPCATCGHDQNELKHIGKSSVGWVFALHVYPENDICDLDDWERLWASGGVIRDEYGQHISAEEMRSIITERARSERWEESPYGYRSWEDFHRDNHSEKGPKGLLRARLRDTVVKHGDGTWDCHIGEFS